MQDGSREVTPFCPRCGRPVVWPVMRVRGGGEQPVVAAFACHCPLSNDEWDDFTDEASVMLDEAGYRCAVPTRRSILAIDLHHIEPVAQDGNDTPDNLIALCPSCHALYERGTIKSESIHAWKAILASLSRAFDQEAIENLLFIKKIEKRDQPVVFPLIAS